MITVGKILKPIGVKGEVLVLPLTSNINRFNKVKFVYLPEKEEIEYFRQSRDKIIIKFKGYDDYNKAFLYLKGKEIMLPDEEIIEKKEDEYFIHELIGCKIIDEKFGELGVVKNIVEGGNEILVVEGDKQIMIPFVREFCKKVDIKSKIIEVMIPEDLLILNSES